MNVDDNDANDDAKLQRTMKFCLQQLRLLLMKQVRYPVDFLRWAFQAFSLSPSAYFFLHDSCLLLPHPSYLLLLTCAHYHLVLKLRQELNAMNTLHI